MTDDTERPVADAAPKDKAGRPRKGDKRRKPPERKRKTPRNSHTSPRKIKREERKREALEYRKQGYTYAQIGTEMGMDPAEVFRLVDEGIKEIAQEAAEELLKLELDRLDSLLAAHYATATEADIASGDFVLKIMAHRAKLLGLNAAERVAHEGKVGIEHSGEVVLSFSPADATA